jgi:CheY-like chemotaxis protein
MIAAQPQNSPIPPDGAAEPREAPPAARRILVVEDEESIREAVVEFLDDSGYQAVGAGNGRIALDRLTGDSGPPPCLILLDLMMPVMDGRSFRERQLQIPTLAEIPVVVFSAHRDLAATAAEMQVAAHLMKPVKLSELLRTIQRHCRTGNA